MDACVVRGGLLHGRVGVFEGEGGKVAAVTEARGAPDYIARSGG